MRADRIPIGRPDRPWLRRVRMLGVLSLSLAPTACQEPTQVQVLLTTDVDCGLFEDVGITVATVDDSERTAVVGTTEHCGDDGYVGTLTILPGSDLEAPVGVRVVAGVGTTHDTCVPPEYEPAGSGADTTTGCIVARRAVRFIAQTPLTLPIPLSESCVGHPCNPDSTCVDGVCTTRWIATDGGCPDNHCTPELLPTCEVTHRCEGDATADGVIDLLDLDLVAARVGTACGQAQFDPQADVNHDLVVDDADRQLVEDRFGCGCPVACPGDATGDGQITTDDLNEVALSQGTCNAPDTQYQPQADFDGNGQVGGFEVLLVDLLRFCSCDDLCGCQRTHPCPGDVNGDGQIDGLDLDALTAQLDTTCGDPAYWFTADFDSDNDVDIVDLGILESHMNQSCTPQ